jgi:hypothetical protein
MIYRSANWKKIAKQIVGLQCFDGAFHAGKQAKLLLAKLESQMVEWRSSTSLSLKNLTVKSS